MGYIGYELSGLQIGSGKPYPEYINHAALVAAVDATTVIGQIFVLTEPQGVFWGTKKKAGQWISDGGSPTDFRYLGKQAENFNDANYNVFNNLDSTRKIGADASQVPTGTTGLMAIKTGEEGGASWNGGVATNEDLTLKANAIDTLKQLLNASGNTVEVSSDKDARLDYLINQLRTGKGIRFKMDTFDGGNFYTDLSSGGQIKFGNANGDLIRINSNTDWELFDLQTNGVFFNRNRVDKNFTFRKLTADDWLDYDAGNDTLDLMGRRFPVAIDQPASTGLIQGCDISINVSGTTIDIASGSGQVIDNHTNPLLPVYTASSYAGATNITLTNIATSPATFLAINSAGTLTQQIIPFTNSERRDYWWVGFASHVDNVNVDSVGGGINSVASVNSSLFDIIAAVGLISSGSVYSGNSSAELIRTLGTYTGNDINFYSDRKDPNVKSLAAGVAGLSFLRAYDDGSSGLTLVSATTIDFANYDNLSGILQSVSTNQWSIQRIYFFANGSTTVTYGQATYTSLDDAIANKDIENPTLSPFFQDSFVRAFLFVRGGGSDLSIVGDAQFLKTSRFGYLGGS